MAKKSTGKDSFDNSLKKIAKTSFIVLIGIIFSKILAYAYRIIIARGYGVEVYGLFSLTIMVLSWILALSSLGLLGGILRFVPLYRGRKEENKIRYVIRLSIILLVVSSVLSSILLFFLSEGISLRIFHDNNLIIFLKIASFFIPFYVLFYAFLTIINAFERMGVFIFLSEFLLNLTKVSLILVFIYLGIKSNAIVLSYMLSMLVMFFVSYFYCRFRLSGVFEKFILNKDSRKHIRKEIFAYSLPLTFFGIFLSIFPCIDSFAIGYFMSLADVGIYNIAVPIAELLTIFPALFIRLFNPLVTREFSKNNLGLVDGLSKQVEKWVIIFNIPLFLLIFIFPGAFINILFGSEYLLAETSLRILAAGFFILSLSSIPGSLILMVGKSRALLIDMIIASGISLVLNIIFTPMYGLKGAAAASLLSILFICVLFFIQAKKFTSIIPLRRKIYRVVLSAIISLSLLFFIRHLMEINIINIILQAIFFIASYILLIFLTKSLDKNDFMILKSIRKKIYFSKYRQIGNNGS